MGRFIRLLLFVAAAAILLPMFYHVGKRIGAQIHKYKSKKENNENENDGRTSE